MTASPTPASSIHGHEVIALMLDSAEPFTRESLVAAIHRQFGTAARFHTCSAEGMDAAELVNFLESRGKFQPAGPGFRIDESRVCRH